MTTEPRAPVDGPARSWRQRLRSGLHTIRNGRAPSAVSAARDAWPPDRWLTVSLLVAAVITAWPQIHDASLAFFALLVTLLASLRLRLGWIALLVLFGVGIDLRVAELARGGSDVADAIRAAMVTMLNGGNPYAYPAIGPQPPPPFPYGPLALVWYLPLFDPRLTELCVSGGLVALLALRGRPLGLALWATAPVTVRLAGDGSNDHSAALFLLIALVVLERLPRAGAALLGVSAGFKIYSLAWLPPILFWLGAVPVLVGIVGFIAIWLPAVVLWSFGHVLNTFRAADAVHPVPYYSLGELLKAYGVNVPRETLNVFRLIAGAATAVITAPFVRTFKGVVVCGMLTYIVALYTGFWSTAAYLIPLLLIGCWYVDLWLGPNGGAASDPTRIRWPRDPVGALMAWVDRRWPRVDAARIAR